MGVIAVRNCATIPVCMGLQKFKRHQKKCCENHGIKRDDRSFTRCRCPWQFEGTLELDRFVRGSFQTADGEEADEKIRLWEAAKTRKVPAGFAVTLRGGREIKAPPAARTTLAHAVETFLADRAKSGLQAGTVRKFKTILRDRLIPFADSRQLEFVSDVSGEQLVAFRHTWEYSLLSAQKHIERLRTFFAFCIGLEWIPKNPAKLLTVKVPRSQKDPFEPAEIDRIMDELTMMEDGDGVDRRWIGGTERVRAFIFVMLYGGLGISDAVQLQRSSLRNNALLLRRRKSGGDVYVPLPDGSDERPDVIAILNRIKPESDRYFFWSGNGKVNTAATNWAKRLSPIFSRAGIPGCPTHRFRHTFAAEHLKRGVSIENVSAMMGHSSVKITELHYAKWSKGRQSHLNEEVRARWAPSKLVVLRSHRPA